MSKYGSTLVSAPPGAPEGVFEGLAELGRVPELETKELSLWSYSWVSPAVPYVLSSLCNPSKLPACRSAAVGNTCPLSVCLL